MNKLNLHSSHKQLSYSNSHKNYDLNFPVVVKKAILCMFISMMASSFVHGQIYVNGPLVNSPGTGVGGADEAVLQTSLGLGLYGYGFQVGFMNTIADDFTIPPGELWQIDEVMQYAYQTGSSTVSTITDLRVRIWDGPPGGGANVIFGDLTTNLLSNTNWSNAYRVTEADSGVEANRPVMANTALIGIVLPAGTYWLEWQAAGSLASGPWAPAMNINGQAVTGNALRSLDNGTTFDPALDAGFAQGFPFVLQGMILPQLNISCPPALSLSCSDVIPPGATAAAEFIAQGGTISSGAAATVSFVDTPLTGNCGSIERTYTVDDGVDVFTCIQLISVTDTEAPDITMCPTSLTNLTCFENPPAAATTLAEFIGQGGSVSDNCTDVNDLIFVSSIGNNGNSFCDSDGAFVITRTYTIIDACGNAATCDQTFTYLESTVGPIITEVPPTCYKNCIQLANLNPDDLEYTTDCSFGATVSISDPIEDGTYNCPGTSYTYTYTVTDDCGRTATATQVIITDNPGPTITCPSFNLILECNDPNNEMYINTHLSQVNATSSCWMDIDITNDYSGLVFGSCTNSTDVVVFTATDACARVATCFTTITILDNLAPTITEIPPSVCDAIECGAVNSEYWFNHWIEYMLDGLVATDQCDANVSWTTIPANPQLNEVCDPITGDAVTIVTFVATDNCSNTATVTGSFIIENDFPPVYENVPPDDNVSCGDPIVFGPPPTLVDECQATEDVMTVVDNSDPCNVLHKRTWTATDLCGGVATSVTQTITETDEDAPVISGGGNITVECDGNDNLAELQTWLDDNAGASGADPCDNGESWSNDFDPSNIVTTADCAAGIYSYVDVTFTATDNCANSSAVTFRFNSADTTAPMFDTTPQNGVIACDESPVFDNVTATDICSGSANVSESDIFAGDACAGSYTRTWTTTDGCGNTATVSQTFSYSDNEVPVFTSVPSGGNFECSTDAVFGEPAATDNCNDVNISHADEVIGDGCTGSVIRTYTATDACGNSATASATVSYDDSEAPVFTSVPTGGNYECASDAVFDEPAATDNCNMLTIDFTDEVTGDGCTGSVIRIYVATDACGNSSTASAMVAYDDSEEPEFTFVPAGGNFECSIDAEFADATAEDNCNVVTITSNDAISGDDCTGSVTRTWTATDACGNSTTASATASYDDTQPPVFTNVPAGGNLTCASDAMFGEPDATDNCNEVTITSSDETSGTTCVGNVTRTWTATDICGNSATVSATASYEDDVPPEFTSVPTGGDFECQTDVTFGTPITMDNCNTVAVDFTDAIVGDACVGSIIRTWTATDLCGNVSTASATATYEDDVPPVFSSVPADANIACDAQAVFGEPVATDYCNSVNVNFTDDFFGDACVGAYIRTWTATDACGNTATASQALNYEDTEAPVFTLIPQGGVVACLTDVVFGDPELTDNCNLITVTSNDETNGDDCTGGVIRIWTATDACGNSSTASATITIVDNEAPVFTSVPVTGAFACLADIIWGTATAVDNCNNVAITFADDIVGNDCLGTVTRTWTATDDCGNATSAVQVVEVSDNTPPEILCTPSTVRFLNNPFICELLDFLPIQANDNCSEFDSIMISWTMDFGNDGIIDTLGVKDNGTNLALIFPIGINVAVFTATDACGNATTCSAILEVIDNVPPAFFCISQTESLNVITGTVSTAAIDYVFEPFNECCVDTILFDIGPPGNPILVDSIEWDCDDNSMLFPNGVDTKITVFDCYGNSASCITKTIVLIPEGSDICDPPGPPGFATVIGTIFTEEIEYVENVTVDLNGGMSDSYLTSTDGAYGFTDLPLGNNYVITPEMDIEHLNGVSTYDLVLISKHILEIQTLDSPYKMIAADINRSGSITTLDMVQLRKVILFIEEDFPNNTSWRFVDADFVFPSPTNPFATTFPETAGINGLEANEQHDFVGVKIGDVNGTVVPNNLLGGDDRSFHGDLHFDVKDKMFEAGEQYEVVFRSADFEAIAGYQYTLNFDVNKLDFIGLEAGDLPGMSAANFGLSLLPSGAITTSWTAKEPLSLNAETELFRITFIAKQAVQLSDVLFLNSRFTLAEGYDINTSNGQLNLLNIDLRFEADEEAKFVLYQNAPNPFRDETLIGFNLPEASTATLTITDLAGRILYQIERDFVKGFNSVDIDANVLGTQGVVYYSLVTPARHSIKKMILIND